MYLHTGHPSAEEWISRLSRTARWMLTATMIEPYSPSSPVLMQQGNLQQFPLFCVYKAIGREQCRLHTQAGSNAVRKPGATVREIRERPSCRGKPNQSPICSSIARNKHSVRPRTVIIPRRRGSGSCPDWSVVGLAGSHTLEWAVEVRIMQVPIQWGVKDPEKYDRTGFVKPSCCGEFLVAIPPT